MNIKLLFTASLLFILTSKCFTQTNPHLVGVWIGTSICQIKNSPCHDEKIVYHISKLDSLNSFQIVMKKIVNNKEEDMGALRFVYDAAKSTLISIDKDSGTKWEFGISGTKLNGTLIYKNQLYRIVEAIKN